MKVFDPIGEINPAPQGKRRRSLETVVGRRVGFLWGRHAASVKFWPVLEDMIQTSFVPSEVYKVYKESTWNPVSADKLQDLASKIDYAIIGVGA